ncbi:MAG: hypothetical protein ACOC1K_03460 [Nanoarchaeota archaeon]
MRAKKISDSLNEFERGTDPKRALGISTRAKLEDWAEEAGIPTDKYVITDDLRLVVNNNLDLRGTNVDKIPEKLHVEGSLFIGRSNINSLPHDLIVGGNLFLGDSNIDYSNVPRSIKVGGKIYESKTSNRKFV